MIRPRLITILLLLTLLATPLVALAASDISNAQWFGLIRIVNNSTATNNVATTANISTPNLIAGNFLNAGANNTAMRSSSGAEVKFMPAYTDANFWSIWVPTIGANSILSYILYTANSTGGEIVYFGGDTGMTIADDASMEPGDNFTFEIPGWFDTSTPGKKIIEKPAAFELRVDPSENVTAAILTSDNVSPTGFIDPDTAWANDTNAFDSNTTTFTRDAGVGAGAWSSYLIMTIATSNITGIQYFASTNGGNFDAIAIDLFYDGDWQVVYNGVFANNTWESRYITSTQESNRARFRMHNGSGGPLDATLFEFNFWTVDDVVSVTTSVSSEDYNIKLEARGDSDKWATGDVLEFYNNDATSEIDSGVLYNGDVKLWVSLWFNTDGTYTSAATSDYFLWSKRPAGAPVHLLQIKLEEADGKLYFEKLVAGVEVFSYAAQNGGGDITSWTGWHHVLASISSVNGARLIVDGGTVVTDADVTAAPAGGSFVIGNLDAAPTLGFQGEISNVITGIDDLTPTEEAALYNGIAPTDAVDYWHISEGGGTTITSTGTVGNTGTAGASNTWATANYTGTDRTGRLCDFVLSIDDTTARGGTNLQGVSVPDNANNWAITDNVTMLYLQHFKEWVGGNLVEHIQWGYGATFIDLSGNGNDATPSFRTASSDPDVSANMTSFLPISEAKAPDYVLGIAPPFISATSLTGNITGGNFTTAIPPGTGTFPLAGVIIAVANATSTPTQIPLLIIAAMVILAVSLTTSALLREKGVGSLVVKIFAITAIMGIFVAFGNFGIDFWMLCVFLIFGIALAMGSRHLGWV